MSITSPTTAAFTGLPPVTGNSTSLPNGQFTIPDDWNRRCHQDHDWCRHFIEEAIKNLQLPSLFPGVTLAPVKQIDPSVIRDIKDRCQANVTCYNEAVKAEQYKLTEDYLMERFPNVGTVSTGNQLQIVLAVGLLTFFFAILGSALLFYFVFIPYDQVGCSFGIPFFADDPLFGDGPPPQPPQEPFQPEQGFFRAAPEPVPGPAPMILPGQNLPMTGNQGLVSSVNNQSRGRSANTINRKSSKKSKKQSKSKKKAYATSSKQPSKKSKNVSKSSKYLKSKKVSKSLKSKKKRK